MYMILVESLTTPMIQTNQLLKFVFWQHSWTLVHQRLQGKSQKIIQCLNAPEIIKYSTGKNYSIASSNNGLEV